MKKVMGILAVSAALVGFSACGGDDGGGDPAKAGADLIAQLEKDAEEQGMAIDLECVDTQLDGLTEPEIKDLIKYNTDADETKLSEKLQTVVGSIGDECFSSGEEATDDTTVETTEESTPE